MPQLSCRSNAPGDVRAICREMFGALKGVAFPVHVMSVDGYYHGRSPYVVWHRRPATPYRERDLIQIADDLYVTTPARTLFDLVERHSEVALAKVVMELYGLYAIQAATARLSVLLADMDGEGAFARDSRRFSAYYGTDGDSLYGTASRGLRDESSPEDWIPCRGRSGEIGGLWKRPPLLLPDELATYLDSVDGLRGSRRLKRAAAMALPGSGSPLETQVALVMGGATSRGQEGLPPFKLNRRVRLPGGEVVVPDMTWENSAGDAARHCCDMDGAAFHGDAYSEREIGRRVNDDSARRAAFDHAGIGLTSITYAQLASLRRWDIVMDTVFRHLGLERAPMTDRFLRNRDALRAEVLAPGL